MAKKKASSAATLEEQVNEKFGANIVVSARYLQESKKVVVPVSPMIDGMLNGGVPFGSFMILTGPPKVGKTSLALDVAASALDVPTDFEQERKLYIFNVEHRLNLRDLEGIAHLWPHVEAGRVEIIQSDEGSILAAEEFLGIGEQFINEKPGSIFVFDSFSNLCSKEGFAKEWDGKGFRDDVPKLLSLFCKRISGVTPIRKSIVIGITHQIANTGFGFSPWAEASGTKIQFAVDVKMKATHKTPWKEGNTVIGQDVHWECYASPLQNGPSETSCVSKLRYGYGIDKVSELINVAVDLGIIDKGGAWYTLPDGTKANGLEKCRTAIIDNGLYNAINTQYREMMGI